MLEDVDYLNDIPEPLETVSEEEAAQMVKDAKEKANELIKLSLKREEKRIREVENRTNEIIKMTEQRYMDLVKEAESRANSLITAALSREADKAREADERIRKTDERANELVKVALKREEDRVREAEKHYKDLMDQVIKRSMQREAEFRTVIEETKRRSREIEDRANDLVKISLQRDNIQPQEIEQRTQQIINEALDRAKELAKEYEGKYFDALAKNKELEDKIMKLERDNEELKIQIESIPEPVEEKKEEPKEENNLISEADIQEFLAADIQKIPGTENAETEEEAKEEEAEN